MALSFERYSSPTKRSLALRAFNEHQTEINEHFWSYAVMSDFTGYMARQKNKTDPLFSTALLFSASGPDSLRIPPNVSEWLDAQKELSNWLRSSAIVSAIAFHEAYIRHVVRTALMSDPLCRMGLARRLDGVKLLKSGHELPFKDEIEVLTRGVWSSRSASFGKIFAAAPEHTMGDIASLEKMRDFRNNFAHGFGRDIKSTPNPTAWRPDRSDRLSPDLFLEWLSTLSKSAASIDKFLLDNYIGSFEFIFHYHQWKSRGPTSSEIGMLEHRALKNYIYADLGYTIGREYCISLIDFYRNS